MSMDFSDKPILQDYWRHTRLRQLRQVLRASFRGGIGLWQCSNCGELRMMKTYPYTKIGKQIFETCQLKNRNVKFTLAYKITAEDIAKIKTWYDQLRNVPKPTNL
jgi:hypothetical protein